MTTGETAVVVVAALGVVAVVLLGLALLAVSRALRSLQTTVELVRQDAAARSWPAGGAAPAGAIGVGGPAGPARRPRDAGSLLARVAVANPYLDVSSPVIKVLALASGTTRAASRLRRARQEG